MICGCRILMKKLLQVSFGLRRRLIELADKHEATYIDGENRYGACDLPILEAKALGVDKVIHVGHSKFMNSDLPVEYVELREDYNPIPVLEKNLDKLNGFKKIGLLTTAQFLDSLDLAKNFLEKNGIKALIGRGGKRNYPGQIL